MEKICGCILKNVNHDQIIARPGGSKLQLMLSNPILNRIVILGFMVLVGFCLARGIYYKSVMGIILALTSLLSGLYFLYLLTKMKKEMRREEANNMQL